MDTNTSFMRLTSSLLASSALWIGAPLAAQETDVEQTTTETPGTVAISTTTDEVAGIYAPDYFTRFAPRNALDMLREVPGFNIQGGGGDNGDGGRGLGQADENVLINGERLSSKSDSARDQLSRIPADKVIRIEIVEGTTLDIPGLTGQVANIFTSGGGLSGQFEWRGGFRPVTDRQEYFGGEVSVSGALGKLGYTLALGMDNNRFGAKGVGLITDATGNLIETQEFTSPGKFDRPSASANLKYDFSDDVTANLNLSYEREYFDRNQTEFQFGTGLVDRNELSDRRNREYQYEIGADIEFPLGPGRLKLIGLESFESGVFTQTLVTSFADGSDDTGNRFISDGQNGERIARAEYGWNMLGADWQLSGEAAFNRLDRVASLFDLTNGDFVEAAFPEGTGGVTEDRYEGILSFSTQLTDKLALQATAGGEISNIQQTGVAANARRFKRPKGSASLSWRPKSGFDISLELSRTVGQLSFGDVLARVFLDSGNRNAGNNELVPEQSWNLDLEINKSLGAWGSTTFTIQHRRISDYIDVIPLLAGGEARGNIDSAKRTDFNWNTTLKFDPLGIPGAQIDLDLQIVRSSVRDPLDGQTRVFSRLRNKRYRAEFRHDIPRSDIAYGLNVSYADNNPYFRRGEVGLEKQGPTFADLFVEHKDVFGLTVKATAGNLLGGDELFERTVWDGTRDVDPILFVENRTGRIGPIFRFSVSGNF